MFQSNLDVKLPGVNTAHLKFNIPRCLKREHWVVHITGKWFNYGILFFVMLLDLNMWKNQIFYNPLDFGQYVGPDDRIFSVMDDWSLSHYQNETVFSYAWRTTNIDPLTNQMFVLADTSSNSRFRGKPLWMRGLAFIPSVCVLIMFGVLIIIFGREGTKQFEKKPKKNRTTSERVIGVRISKVDPELDETDRYQIEIDEKNQPDGSPSSDANTNYGAVGTSPPVKTAISGESENNSNGDVIA